MTIAANIYCAPNDLIDRLSLSGLTFRTDDSPPSTYGNAVARAGSIIDMYCSFRYTPDQLAQSPAVVDWAANVAAWIICNRRGDPAPQGIGHLYEQSIAFMKEVKSGITQIPGIAIMKSFAPVMSKMKVTMRPYPNVRVETSQGASTGGQPINYHQHRDVWDKFGWNVDAWLDNAL